MPTLYSIDPTATWTGNGNNAANGAVPIGYDGKLFVALHSGNDIAVFRSLDSGATWTNTGTVATSGAWTTYYAVSANGSTLFLAYWNTTDQIALVTYDMAASAVLGTAVLTSPTYAGSDAEGLDVVARSDGSAVVIWRHDPSVVRYATVSAAGVFSAVTVLSGSGTQSASNACLGASDVVHVWMDPPPSGAIYTQHTGIGSSGPGAGYDLHGFTYARTNSVVAGGRVYYGNNFSSDDLVHGSDVLEPSDWAVTTTPKTPSFGGTKALAASGSTVYAFWHNLDNWNEVSYATFDGSSWSAASEPWFDTGHPTLWLMTRKVSATEIGIVSWDEDTGEAFYFGLPIPPAGGTGNRWYAF